MSKILGLNIPVFGAIVSSVGVVLIALTAGIVVCCCRKRAVQRRNNTNCAGTVAVSSINIIKSFQAFPLLRRVGFELFLQFVSLSATEINLVSEIELKKRVLRCNHKPLHKAR
jgi:hypothetical protein